MNLGRPRFRRVGFVTLAASLPLLLVLACKKEAEPKVETEQQAATGATAAPSGTAKTKPKRDPKEIEERRKAMLERLKQKRTDAKPVAKVKPTPDDPEKGDFTLEEATKGLAGDEKGALLAEIQTDAGTLNCELFPDKAPITVANFIGLARGIRPWKDGKTWVKKPIFDGTPFHRVIKGFMVQGGDPAKDGSGGPGYVIPDEIWAGAKHDTRGQLCMANRGPNTNGSQFFILDAAARHLDGGYTIFGQCSPDTVIEKIAGWQVSGDRAVNPPKIKKVVIKRGKPSAEPAADGAKAAATSKATSPAKGSEPKTPGNDVTPKAAPAATKPQGT